MVDCKFVTTPMELNFKKLCGSVVGPGLANPSEYHQLVGALMFLVNSRPNICFTVNTLIQYMVKPHHIHWISPKNLLRYLWGIIHYGLRYIFGNLRLHGYTDADWAGSVVDHKRTSRWCFSLGFGSISWISGTISVSLSTSETKYIAMSMAYSEAIWLRNLFNELFEHVLHTTVIFWDNQSQIHLSENPMFHNHSKHINIRYHLFVIW